MAHILAGPLNIHIVMSACLQMKYYALMIKGQKTSELILYSALWTILFIAPVLSMYWGTLASTDSHTIDGEAVDAAFEWHALCNAWLLLAFFFITFVIHNFMLAPLIVYGGKKWLYGGLTVVLMGVFVLCQSFDKPPRPRDEDERVPERLMRRDSFLPAFRPDGYGKVARKGPLPPPEHAKDARKMRKKEPPLALGGREMVAFIIMSLLIGLNVGTKYFFKSLDDRKRMKELERENLDNQLKYLKYQINPHFFMNTLNNIHALVDIDPEEAKYTIEVLSKLMRYVLYENNNQMVPLQRELDFLAHYIDLMRIRYTDKVCINVSMPEHVPDVRVPSLLYATFVENAFKHGVSYQKSSFIDVCVRVDDVSDKIEFLCVNSMKPSSEDRHDGVGLKNAVRRLRLIYGLDYDLQIHSDGNEYHLVLRLPMRHDASQNDMAASAAT